MGKCKFCGNPAGLFSSKHKECEKAYESGKQQIIFEVEDSVLNGNEFPKLKESIEEIAKTSFIDENTKKQFLIDGLNQAVDKFLEDGIIDSKEEETLNSFTNYFQIEQDDLDKNNLTVKIVKALVLRDVMEGEVNDRVGFQGNLPFLMQKSETVLWIFQDVNYYHQKTKTTYQGGSQGVSFRVAKGVYYRTGGFKAQPVKQEVNQLIGTGLLVLTNKHLYFHCPEKSLKIPYNKIISLQSYQNALGIQKDGVSAKPMTFENIDEWFVYNLISNLNN